MNRLIAALCLVACSVAAAADGLHPWIVPAPRLLKETYFSNVHDGDSIETPFVLKFGLTGMGLAPIVQPVPMTGHHHLLVNRELPMDFTKPLPFNDQYIHFGKGQMETVVDLPPGSYSMRLVLADQGHIPYFVFSKPLNFTVTKQNKGVTAASLLGEPNVGILNVADRARLQSPFRLQLHASGYNLSNVAAKAPDTGHFRLTLERPGQKAEVIELNGGQTELWLSPPKGDYSARLELVSNAAAGKVMATSKPLGFTVP